MQKESHRCVFSLRDAPDPGWFFSKHGFVSAHMITIDSMSKFELQQYYLAAFTMNLRVLFV